MRELLPDQLTIIASAFSLAALAALYLAWRDELPLRRIAIGILLCFVGAMAGGHGLHAILHIHQWIADPERLLDGTVRGTTSLGALLGGTATFAIYAHFTKIGIWRTADALAPAAGIGLGVARLGCFAHGCDFGRMTSLPWGVRYAAGEPAFEAQLRNGFIGPYQTESLPVHPFQPLLSGWGIVVFLLFLFWPTLGRRSVGNRAVLAAVCYFGGRFLLEFLRSPYTSPLLGFLNLAQWLCLLALIVFFILWRAKELWLAQQSAKEVCES